MGGKDEAGALGSANAVCMGEMTVFWGWILRSTICSFNYVLIIIFYLN